MARPGVEVGAPSKSSPGRSTIERQFEVSYFPNRSAPVCSPDVRTSFQSPWQNGVAERWVENCLHHLLDHVIALNEAHLKRLLSDYFGYYHEDRTHLGLGKNTPSSRARSAGRGRITSLPRLGGLHHRYQRAA
jgi:hypothetical protein